MIIYKDILKKLDEAGYSTYQLRKEKVLSESVISRLRNNQDVSLTTLDTIVILPAWVLKIWLSINQIQKSVCKVSITCP
jgi:hypothetical protein